MLSHQQRVLEERNDLEEKLTKLVAFLNSEIYNKLPGEEKVRLSAQSRAMAVYLCILNERIAAF